MPPRGPPPGIPPPRSPTTADGPLCVVCAEPLYHVGVPACGHDEACSKCALRLRIVLQDLRCVVCRSESDALYVTRRGGPVPSDYAGPRARADAGDGVWRLAAANAFFDDQRHWGDMKALTALTHAALMEGGGDGGVGGSGRRGGDSNRAPHRPPRFPTMRALRAALRERGLHLCGVCLDGRKVFASEQQVYTEASLSRHNASGDVGGPLAAAGFKGHPPCAFCRKRFYSDAELFTHMQTQHEHCFLCRRAAPGEWEYFRDYADLDAHFSTAHHACRHAACVAARFVVFGSAAELAAHAAREHGGEVGATSRAERRAALTIPIDVQFRPRGGGGCGCWIDGGGGAGPQTGGAEAEAEEEGWRWSLPPTLLPRPHARAPLC